MDRTQKQEQVENLHIRFGEAEYAFLLDYKGLSVAQDTELRTRLRGANVDYRVVKNRLAKLALKDTSLACLVEHFRGPTSVALGGDDAAAVAKILVDFTKANEDLEIKAGLLEGGLSVTPEQVKSLSELPSLPELRAQMLSVILAPATRLVTVLSEPGRQLVRVLDARRQALETEA